MYKKLNFNFFFSVINTKLIILLFTSFIRLKLNLVIKKLELIKKEIFVNFLYSFFFLKKTDRLSIMLNS